MRHCHKRGQEALPLNVPVVSSAKEVVHLEASIEHFSERLLRWLRQLVGEVYEPSKVNIRMFARTVKVPNGISQLLAIHTQNKNHSFDVKQVLDPLEQRHCKVGTASVQFIYEEDD